MRFRRDRRGAGVDGDAGGTGKAATAAADAAARAAGDAMGAVRDLVEPGSEADANRVAREAGEVLVAALEESDAPGEVLADAAEDAAAGHDARRRRRWRIGIGSAVLVVLGVVAGVRRRRRRDDH